MASSGPAQSEKKRKKNIFGLTPAQHSFRPMLAQHLWANLGPTSTGPI